MSEEVKPKRTRRPKAEVKDNQVERGESFIDSLKRIQQGFKAAEKLENNEVEMRKLSRDLEVLKTTLREHKNEDILKKVLQWERSRKLIGVVDEYELNELEEKDANGECRCYTKPRSVAIVAEIGEDYRYTKQFDESRGCDVYTTFLRRRIAPEEQIPPELMRKINLGYMPKEEEYLPEKTQIRRLVLVESEWEKIFKDLN